MMSELIPGTYFWGCCPSWSRFFQNTPKACFLNAGCMVAKSWLPHIKQSRLGIWELPVVMNPYFKYVSWYFLLNAACKLFLLVAIVSSSDSVLGLATKLSKDVCFLLVLLVYGFNISVNGSGDWKKHLDMRPEWLIGGCNREKFSVSFFNINFVQTQIKTEKKSKSFILSVRPGTNWLTGGWGPLLYTM